MRGVRLAAFDVRLRLQDFKKSKGFRGRGCTRLTPLSSSFKTLSGVLGLRVTVCTACGCWASSLRVREEVVTKSHDPLSRAACLSGHPRYPLMNPLPKGS